MSFAALKDVRVLEVASGLAAGVCGRLLADQGAEVIRLEHGSGPIPEHEATDLVWQWARANKRIAREITSDSLREAIERLAPEADLLVTDVPHRLLSDLGMTPEALSASHSGLNVVAITPFGRTGPYADFAGGDIVQMAMSGYLYMSGLNDLEPLRFGMDMVEATSGLNAAAGALVALHHTRETGRGQVVEVTHLETMLSMALSFVLIYPMLGTVSRRRGSRYAAVGAILPGRDGHIGVVTYRVPSDMLATLLDAPDLLDERFETALGREQHGGAFQKILKEAVAKREKSEIFHTAQELRFPWAMVQSPEEVLGCPQHTSRSYFQPLRLQDGREIPAPALPFVNTGEQRSVPKPPEQVQANTVSWTSAPSTTIAAKGDVPTANALEGLKVVEVTFAWAGPIAGRILADYGATVIRVESGRYTDTARSLPLVDMTFGERWYDRCPPYLVANAGKRHIGLELDQPEGRDVFLDLVRWADVLIESHTPRVMPNLGLDWESLSEVNPRLIMLSSTGFGQDGPYRNFGAWGWGLEALAGVSYDTGYAGDPDPLWFQATLPDPLSALTGVVAIMSALEERRRTGRGQWIDLSQYEVSSLAALPQTLEYAATGKLRDRIGNRHRWLSPQGVYPCEGSDEWVAIGVSTDEQWRTLCAVIERDDLAEDTELRTHPDRWARQQRIDDAIAGWTRQRTKYGAMRTLQDAGIPAGILAHGKEVHEDSHIKALEFFRAAEAKETGLQVYSGPWQRLSATPGLIRSGPAGFSEDSQFVLSDILGYSEAQIDRIAAAGVLPAEPTKIQRPPTPAIPVEAQLKDGTIREWAPDYRDVAKKTRRDG